MIVQNPLPEAAKHLPNVSILLQNCALHGVFDLSLSAFSVDPFLPSVLTETDLAPLVVPLRQDVLYDDYPFVKDELPPMVVLMEGDSEKKCVGDFYLPMVDIQKPKVEFKDLRVIPRVRYDQVDWSYPNIILVIGNEAKGISNAIASKDMRIKI